MMINSPRKKILFSFFLVLLLLGTGLLLFMFTRQNSSVIVPPAGPITIEGILVCLPHKNTDGPQTLECAYGLKDDNNRYFSLGTDEASGVDLYSQQMNTRLEIGGIFTPDESTIYQSIGRITVTSIKLADTPERTTLTGEYICLPHKDISGPQTDECAFGLKTAKGNYALDFSLMSSIPEVNVGDRITANGLLVPIEQISTDQWQKYDIIGIFSATDGVRKI